MTDYDDDDEIAHRAADMIDLLREQLLTQEREIEQLSAELRTAQLVGTAIGVLMTSSSNYTEDEAEQALRESAEAQHLRLRDLATRIIETRTDS